MKPIKNKGQKGETAAWSENASEYSRQSGEHAPSKAKPSKAKAQKGLALNPADAEGVRPNAHSGTNKYDRIKSRGAGINSPERVAARKTLASRTARTARKGGKILGGIARAGSRAGALGLGATLGVGALGLGAATKILGSGHAEPLVAPAYQ